MANPRRMEDLIDELRLCLHRVTRVAEALHADESISIGMRGVLEYLLRNSQATVPTIARSRHVSRQLIQTLVSALLDQGLVALVANPAHRRSALVSLTPDGEGLILRMRDKERAFFESLRINLSEARLTAATRTLQALRAELSGDE